MTTFMRSRGGNIFLSLSSSSRGANSIDSLLGLVPGNRQLWSLRFLRGWECCMKITNRERLLTLHIRVPSLHNEFFGRRFGYPVVRA